VRGCSPLTSVEAIGATVALGGTSPRNGTVGHHQLRLPPVSVKTASRTSWPHAALVRRDDARLPAASAIAPFIRAPQVLELMAEGHHATGAKRQRKRYTSAIQCKCSLIQALSAASFASLTIGSESVGPEARQQPAPLVPDPQIYGIGGNVPRAVFADWPTLHATVTGGSATCVPLVCGANQPVSGTPQANTGEHRAQGCAPPQGRGAVHGRASIRGGHPPACISQIPASDPHDVRPRDAVDQAAASPPVASWLRRASQPFRDARRSVCSWAWGRHRARG
jgi:hypothetical protein